MSTAAASVPAAVAWSQRSLRAAAATTTTTTGSAVIAARRPLSVGTTVPHGTAPASRHRPRPSTAPTAPSTTPADQPPAAPTSRRPRRRRWSATPSSPASDRRVRRAGRPRRVAPATPRCTWSSRAARDRPVRRRRRGDDARRRRRRRRRLRRRTGPARPRVHRRRQRAPTSTTPTSSGDTNVAEYAVAADGTFDVGQRTRAARRSTSPTPTTTVATSRSAPTACSTSRMGDGGSGGDPERRASDPTTLLGKMLRIDPTPSATCRTRSRPTTRSRRARRRHRRRPEVWAWGSAQPVAVRHRPGERRPVDRRRRPEPSRGDRPGVAAPTAGRSAVGARTSDGARSRAPTGSTPTSPTPATRSAVLTYRARRRRVLDLGGAVYRGTAIAELAPALRVQRLLLGQAVGARPRRRAQPRPARATSRRSPRSERGPDGELYVLERSGGVHRLVPG